MGERETTTQITLYTAHLFMSIPVLKMLNLITILTEINKIFNSTYKLGKTILAIETVFRRKSEGFHPITN